MQIYRIKILELFQMNAAILYPFALNFAAEAMVSIKRVEEFLLKEEKNESELGLERRSSMVIADTKRKLITLFKMEVPF